mmetsp:Transcript_2321/g.7119  ORF Transcript_2321/g.7119 Transcript_2321/m.7119 type:complete len:279 (-) Transcript_2321:187-1023(-)
MARESHGESDGAGVAGVGLGGDLEVEGPRPGWAGCVERRDDTDRVDFDGDAELEGVLLDDARAARARVRPVPLGADGGDDATRGHVELRAGHRARRPLLAPRGGGARRHRDGGALDVREGEDRRARGTRLGHRRPGRVGRDRRGHGGRHRLLPRPPRRRRGRGHPRRHARRRPRRLPALTPRLAPRRLESRRSALALGRRRQRLPLAGQPAPRRQARPRTPHRQDPVPLPHLLRHRRKGRQDRGLRARRLPRLPRSLDHSLSRLSRLRRLRRRGHARP